MSSSENSGCCFGQSSLRDIPSSLHAAGISDSPVYPDPDPPLPDGQSVVLEQSSHSRDQAEQDQADHDQSDQDHSEHDQSEQDQSGQDQPDKDQPEKDQTLKACTFIEDLLAGHCPDSPLEFTSGQDQSVKDQTLEACIFVKDLLTGNCPDTPLEFTIPNTSFYRLIDDPKFESAREE